MAKKKKAADKAPVKEKTIRDLSTWELPAEEIDRILATEDDPRLRAMFGADYEELRQLARKSAGAVRGTQDVVLLVPGILGSTIGKPGNFFTRDTIWFDPFSIVRGDVTKLALPPSGQSSLQALDVLPVVHTYLRLRLRMFGFTVEYYPYDWRQSIAKLGKELADHIRSRSATNVMLVAHSMGGLVSRAALQAGAEKVSRLVMLGTPNRGSFSPVEVFQGINSTVVMVDRIDVWHDAEQLTKEVFSTIPPLYEMLPRPEVFAEVDLFDPENWPSKPFRPTAGRLNDAQLTWEKLVDGDDDRLRLIAGYQQQTVTGLHVEPNGEFSYETSLSGDGTVPLNMCELPGVPTRYVQATHTGLLRHEGVARAVVELLQTGETSRLDAEPSGVRGGPSVRLSLEDFQKGNQVETFAGRRGDGLAGDELPQLLEAAISLSSMPAAATLQAIDREAKALRTSGTTPPGGDPGTGSSAGRRLTSGISFKQTVISRDLQTHLELELFQGSLFDAPYRAVVLGIFKNVDPTGPAKFLDTQMHGAVSELLERRMFDAEVGKIFVMPTGRHGLRADQVVFVGLGSYSQFLANAESVLRTVSCNVLRTLKNCGVDEFATLIYGGASGLPVRQAVESFVRGYLDALKADSQRDDALKFRRVAFCERSPDKYEELKDEAFRLGGTELCQDIRLRLHEAHYPAASTIAAPVSRDKSAQQPAITYLTVRAEEVRDKKDQWTVYASLLSAGGKATIFPSAKQIDRKLLDNELEPLSKMSSEDLISLGERLEKLLLTNDFIEVLHQSGIDQTHLTVIHDGLASRIPWEILPLSSAQLSADALPCLGQGLSRRYQTDGKNSLAKFLEERQLSEILKVLLISDPTGDLPGAAKEGKKVREVLQSINKVSFEAIETADATRSRILELLGSGAFDVVHYAGHAFFDPEDRGRSGLICSGEEIITGRDISQLDKLPSLVCFNACESGRIRSRFVAARSGSQSPVRKPKDGIETGDVLEQNVGVAEALLRGGIAQFVGTYWPVSDDAAATFAERLYRGIASGKTVRESVIDGRAAIHEDPDLTDFANYLHFGSPGFVVKEV